MCMCRKGRGKGGGGREESVREREEGGREGGSGGEERREWREVKSVGRGGRRYETTYIFSKGE